MYFLYIIWIHNPFTELFSNPCSQHTCGIVPTKTTRYLKHVIDKVLSDGLSLIYPKFKRENYNIWYTLSYLWELCFLLQSVHPRTQCRRNKCVTKKRGHQFHAIMSLCNTYRNTYRYIPDFRGTCNVRA